MTDTSFIDAKMITDAYTSLQEKTLAYFAAQVVYLDGKQALETKVATALAEGTIEGKNADMRKAAAIDYFALEFDALTVTKNNADATKLALDVASIEKGYVNALLRLAEVIAQAEGNEAVTK